MKNQTILILGDSTSMTIGVEHSMYPFLLAGQECWPAGTKFVNCSLPGITSADAAAFFFRHRKSYRPLRAVIIYLGNCDSTAVEIRKGRYTWSRQVTDHLRMKAGRLRKRKRLKNRLLHFEWNQNFDASIEAPEKAGDFEANLARIIRSCRRSDIPVILVRPKANLHFPPGVGKGNFLFYRYLGINEQVADRLAIPDVRFKQATACFEKRDFSAASEGFREILLNSGNVSSNLEYPLIVANNYAVCAAELGNYTEAEHTLELLLAERGSRREILLFNLAQVNKRKGDLTRYKAGLQKAYDADSSLYRVRNPYLEAIDRLAALFKEGVSLFDLHSAIPDRLYLDHCHPLPEGQMLIADGVGQCLADLAIQGTEKAVIENRLYNPELALGNFTEFFEYYRTYAPYSQAEIGKMTTSLKQSLRTLDNPDNWSHFLQPLPREMRLAIRYYLRHPCFPTIHDLLHFGPEYPVDIGRFPEFFLTRYVIPYLRMHAQQPDLQQRFSNDTGLLRDADTLLSSLPGPVAELVSQEDPDIDTGYESGRAAAIVTRVSKDLSGHLQAGNQIYARLKTTIFWYVRESLRFGSHSRTSMRYDRIFLEYSAEALAIAGVLDRFSDAGLAEDISRLVQTLETAARIHESFSAKFSLQEDAGKLCAQYDQRLRQLAGDL